MGKGSALYVGGGVNPVCGGRGQPCMWGEGSALYVGEGSTLYVGEVSTLCEEGSALCGEGSALCGGRSQPSVGGGVSPVHVGGVNQYVIPLHTYVCRSWPLMTTLTW